MSETHKVAAAQGNVPFSWENKPGISKAVHDRRECAAGADQEGQSLMMVKALPLPPCPSGGTRSRIVAVRNDIQIPLPPCTFHQPPVIARSSSARGLKKHEDPFLAAIEECTKSGKRVGGGGGGKWSSYRFEMIGSRLKSMFAVSCKSRASVRDDSLVRLSELPIERD